MNQTGNPKAGFQYRPDIDGLRAVAILSVMAFHLRPWRVPGGFIGVDVFFVISGYLISAIVFTEIADSRFSVLGFYERRVRRILPALFAMLVVVTVIIGHFLLPSELVAYSKSVIAAATSSSNFYFWQHSSYFDAPTSKPLLHTWSLAVEEQFYILFPIFLVIARRFFPQRLKFAVVTLFLASLIAAVVTVHFNSNTAFYMPYTRAWELLLGTLVALHFFPRLRNDPIRNAVTLLGIAMIGYSALRYTAQTPFPGVAALIPCLGSALIIGAGESGSTFVGKFLSWRPVVFIGLISYSLYLWHWPVIILNDLGLEFNPSKLLPHNVDFLWPLQKAGDIFGILTCFILAILSWRFVERPFRSRGWRIERPRLFALAGASLVAMLLTAGVTIYQGGFPGRFPSRAVQVASFLSLGDATLGQLGECVITEENRENVFNDSHCMQAPAGKPTLLLLGDSHARALWDGLKTTLPDYHLPVAAAWGCSPSVHSHGTPLCRQMLDFVFSKYLVSHAIQGLLVEARWNAADLRDVDEIATWAKSRGIPLVVFGPVAEYDAPLPRLLAYSIAWNRPDLAQQHRLAYPPVKDAQMRNLAANTWHVSYVSLYQATCESGRCLEYADEKDGIPLLTDGDHLSEDGSRLLVRRLAGLGELHLLQQKLPFN